LSRIFQRCPRRAETAATAHLVIETAAELQFHTVDFMNWVNQTNAVGMPETRGGRIFAPTSPGLGLVVAEQALGESLAIFD
jgi:L-alanine-DL-glutamate epimerase-like enolase superfamily enzyme